MFFESYQTTLDKQFRNLHIDAKKCVCTCECKARIDGERNCTGGLR